MNTQNVKTSLLALLLISAMLSAALGSASTAQAQEPAVLAYGETVEGELSSEQPSTTYAFDADAGDVVTITMIVVGGAIDPFLVLSDSEGSLLATDDNSGGGLNARVTSALPSAGRYTIQVTHSGGEVPAEGGTFALNLTSAVDDEGVPLGDSEGTRAEGGRLIKLEAGTHVEDVLTRQIALRYYWFLADAAQQVSVRPDLGLEFEPLLTLYDAEFRALEQERTSTGLEAVLAAEGVYLLAVSLPDTNSTGGTYAFTLDAGGLPGSEGLFIPMAYGETQPGTIDDTTPGVTYEFRGAAGDEVTITMRRAAGDLDSYLSLLDAGGQLLYEDNDSGGANGDAQLEYALPADGRYLIVASRLGQASGSTSGSYSLELASDAAPAVVAAEPVLPPEYADYPLIAYGESVEGEILDDQYLMVYVFLGDEGDAVTIDMVSLNPTEADGLDPFLVLLDDGRIPLIEDDDIVDGVERDARIEFTLPRRAFYAIVATRFDQADGTSTGPYTLALRGGAEGTGPVTTTVSQEPVLAQLSPTPLTPGESLQASFGGGANIYDFRGAADALVDLSLTTDEGTDAVVILADENLNEIASGDGSALTGLTLPKTGRYAVFVAPRFGPAEATGSGYILVLTQTGSAPVEALTADDTPRALVYGDTVNGEVDEATTSRSYTFEGLAGERVRITIEATPDSDLDAYVELQDAAGDVVAANDDIDPGVIRDAQITVALPADGRYTIIASRYAGADMSPTEGAFRLSLELLDASTVEGVSSQVAPIGYGDTLYGEITDDQYLLFYVFEGEAGDVVTIEVDNISGNLDSVLHLFRSAGDEWMELANNDDSPTGGTYEAQLSNITLPDSGKYLIAVSRYGLGRESTFGAFSLTVTRQE